MNRLATWILKARRTFWKRLRNLTRDGQHTVVMVTHSREAAAIADAVRTMRDGNFV